VSKKYSQEIQTAEYGFGLDGVLRERSANVTGILNGVDYAEWSPATDGYIASRYKPDELFGKAKCKEDLLEEFGLADANPKLPVIGIVSRFAGQKGFDLVSQVMDRLAREEMILVVLGRAKNCMRKCLRAWPRRFRQDCVEDYLRQQDRAQN